MQDDGRGAAASLRYSGRGTVATLADWPVWRDELPEPLLQATGGDPGAIERFHSCYLGGFIDHDWLWRIDARPEVLQAIAPKLGLSETASAPPEFWDMPPHYWPRSLPPKARGCIPHRDSRMARESSTSC
jgi:hypothetical protein